MPIHPTSNFVPCSRLKSCHASPNHRRPSTMLYSVMDMLRSNVFSISNPTPWPTIWIKLIYLCLVTKNHAFPIINGPIFIPLSKYRVCENMFTSQRQLPLLHLCIQSNLSQSTPHNDVIQQTCFAVANVVPSQPSVTRVAQRLFSRSARPFGHPPLCLSISPLISFLKYTTEYWLIQLCE